MFICTSHEVTATNMSSRNRLEVLKVKKRWINETTLTYSTLVLNTSSLSGKEHYEPSTLLARLMKLWTCPARYWHPPILPAFNLFSVSSSCSSNSNPLLVKLLVVMTNTAAALNQNRTSILKTTSLSQGVGLKTPKLINCLIRQQK